MRSNVIQILFEGWHIAFFFLPYADLTGPDKVSGFWPHVRFGCEFFPNVIYKKCSLFLSMTMPITSVNVCEVLQVDKKNVYSQRWISLASQPPAKYEILFSVSHLVVPVFFVQGLKDVCTCWVRVLVLGHEELCVGVFLLCQLKQANNMLKLFVFV